MKPKPTAHPRGQTRIIHLALAPVTHVEVVAFAALRIESDRVRVFFNQAARADAIEPGRDSQILRVVPIRGGSGLYVDIAQSLPADDVVLGYKGVSLCLKVTDCTPDHLDGEDCLLTTLNQALSVATPADDRAANPMANPRFIRDWLTHHVTHHGATSAVFLNRLGPDRSGTDFAQRMEKHLARKPLEALARIVVLDVQSPTGRLGAVDERHLLHAPEAPSKNRMQAPPPDPWRAPFGDEVLLEYVRHALLAQAQGVAYLDLSDRLTPPAGNAATVFAQARAATPDPFLPLIGRRAFPWKLSDKTRADIGDHICTPFDLDGRFSRWVVSPARLTNKDITWRPHRIIGLRGAAPKTDGLWRFMALRHPGAAPAQLAPKSSLREDQTLVALSEGLFGHKPLRMPQEAPRPLDAQLASSRGDKVVIVTAMKNEGPFLLEWIAHHRAIGVSDIVVFSNDCTDGTDALLDTLAARGIVEHYPNPYRTLDLRPQHAGFRAAEALPTVRNADWLMTMDVDEFLNIHVGDGHLKDLFAQMGDANMISCTWRLFGNGGKRTFVDQPVTAQFTHCARKDAGRPHQAWGFKTLYQNNGYFKKLGVHRPKGLRGQMVDNLRWVNGSGDALPESEYRTAWRSNGRTIGYDLVTLNHYAVRSVESFLVKRDRGRVNHVDRDQGAAYWFRMNHNTTTDTSIQRMKLAVDAELARFLADPEIAQRHATSVDLHKAKITQLLAQTSQRAFHDMLGSARFQSLSKMLPIFGAHVFLAGPDCVPQEMVDQFDQGALPADYSFTVPRPNTTEH